MSRVEFLRWGEFYKLYPFDDFHRYHRPAALVASSFGGGDLRARLEWLFPSQASDADDQEAAWARALGVMKD